MRPLLILRPQPQADATATRARAMGLEARCHPLFALEPVAWTMPAGRFDGLLLTSANAVRLAGQLPPLPVHAVGPATAAMARWAGCDVVGVGEGGVDALLATLPPDLHLLHLAGEERITPAFTLLPCVTAITVYRALALDLLGAATIEGTVAMVHSPAAGARLAACDCDRREVRVAAISPAAAAACGAGWDRVEAAETPTDAALLSLAAQLCKD